MNQDYKQSIRVFKAFCDENRLQILELLREDEKDEKCACELLDDLKIGQSTLSHHMKILCDSGIVAGRKEGKWMYYHIDPEGSAEAAQLLSHLTDRIGDTSIADTPEDGSLCEEKCAQANPIDQ